MEHWRVQPRGGCELKYIRVSTDKQEERVEPRGGCELKSCGFHNVAVNICVQPRGGCELKFRLSHRRVFDNG